MKFSLSNIGLWLLNRDLFNAKLAYDVFNSDSIDIGNEAKKPSQPKESRPTQEKTRPIASIPTSEDSPPLSKAEQGIPRPLDEIVEPERGQRPNETLTEYVERVAPTQLRKELGERADRILGRNTPAERR